jgi:hypothetical protein
LRRKGACLLKAWLGGSDIRRVAFSEQSGPTALHPELVYALSFSQETLPLEPSGAPTRAALVGVWNGERGLVVVVLRQMEPRNVRRFQFDREIESIAALDEAVVQAGAFAADFGFRMDDPRYRDLTEALREERFRKWDEMRKVRRPGSRTSPFTESGCAAGLPGASAHAAARPIEGPAELDASGDTTRSILGRVALVRRGRRKALARILAYF